MQLVLPLHKEPSQVKILVTGWRDWPEQQRYLVWETLNYWAEILSIEAGAAFGLIPVRVTQGECPYGGVDLWAKQWAESLDFATDDPHPANWRAFGKAAGMRRNAEMVAQGADICLAFPGPGSKGTWDCAEKAESAGILTKVFTWSELSDPRFSR